MRYCIKGGKIIDPASGFYGIGDLLIAEGRIAVVGASGTVTIPSDTEIIDAQGMIVCPGFIDLHTHLREPGREDKETIASGTKAALKGGFTAVTAMANTTPVSDNAVVIKYILNQAQQEAAVKVYPVGAISKGLKGEELAEMGEVAAAGAIAFSDDGKTLMNPALLRTAIEYATLFDKPLLLHQEDPDLAGNGVMHEGYWSTVLGLPGIPDIAESTIVARDLEIAAYTKGKIHLCHISTKRSVELLRAAKAKGVKVTAEVTPHHLALTDELVQSFDSVYRVSPPLRSAEDVEAVRLALKDGTIDIIATDHAPHTLEEKHREFSLAPNGMIGLETALGVVWTELVKKGYLTDIQLVEAMSFKPARILNVPGGTLQVGAGADVVVFDPELEWELKASDIVSKSKNSPFIGRKFSGKVQHVWVDGKLKYFNENFTE